VTVSLTNDITHKVQLHIRQTKTPWHQSPVKCLVKPAGCQRHRVNRVQWSA